MKFAVVIIGALVATALADHRDGPSIQNMPNLNKLNDLAGGKIPEIPPGMKIEDLKDAFYNMPPEMKERLNDMAQSFGMQLDDVEDALNNPPQKLKDYFDKNAEGAQDAGAQTGPAPGGLDINSILENVDMGAMGDMMKGMDIEGMMKNMDLGAMGDIMKNVDINGLMKNMDMGAMTDMMKNMDIQGMMQNMDLGGMGDIMKNVDINGLMKNMDMGAMTDMMKNVDIGGMMKNMDMGAMGDIVKNVDIGGMMKNMDLGAMGDMVKNVDVQGLMKNMDMGAMGDIMKNVDVQGMMKNMDLGAMGDIMKNVDIEGLMKNMDMGAMGDIMKNVDINGIMKGMDLGPMGNIIKNMDIGGMMKNMDLGAIGGMMKNMDMGSIMKTIGPMGAMMKNMDMGSIMKTIGPMGAMMKNIDMGSIMKMAGPMMKNMDLGPITGMMKNLDLGAITGMMKGLDLGGIMGVLKEKPIDLDRLIDLKHMAWQYMMNKGVPMDDPMAFLNFVHEKLKDILPADMDLTSIFNMVHGELEAMGFPEDKSQIKEWIMNMAGLDGIKDIDELLNPDVIAKVMMKKAYQMLDIDENEDPRVVKERIHDQLLEEAEKLGASLSKDSSPEDVMKQMDKVLTTHLNEMMGMEADSIMPGRLHNAVMNKLQALGIPVNDFGALKKHVMDMAMKQLMKSVTPMIMNFFMGGSRHPPPPPPMMMPPQMMPPHMMPIDLDISVNVENQQPPMMMPMPGYLHGAEPALEHERLDDMSDEEMFHHIMAVRHGLATGEMPEEILQEMIEDLMNARLRNRVLTVRNMFLNDRIAAMERDMEMMSRGPQQMPPQMPERIPFRARDHRRSFPSSARRNGRQGSPLLRALMKPRVL